MFKLTPPINKNRLKNIDSEYQLIIIGGGIYGAALCWEASHRGIKTLLVEKDDYASGASSNSLKTIHGGLRSLQSFNLPAVIKGIRERSIFLSIAPNYVKPLPCILPTTSNLKRSRLFIGMGLLLYNVLVKTQYIFSRTKPLLPNAKLLSIKKFYQHFPGLVYRGITGGGLWFDAQVTNTERLVLQFIKSARKYHAETLNHTAAISLSKVTNSHKPRLLIQDQINGDEKTVTAAAIVDCSSAWSFITKTSKLSVPVDSVSFLKSVNLVINRKLFDTAIGITIKKNESAHSRLYFFSPWRDCTMIGTWYAANNTDINTRCNLKEAVSYLEDINSVLDKNKQLKTKDICNVHIGYLPAELPQQVDHEHIDKYLLSSFQFKDWSDILDVPNIYSLRGTKYTLARNDAKKVIDKLSKIQKWSVKPSHSDVTLIYQDTKPSKIATKLSHEVISQLITNYGADITLILEIIQQDSKLASIIAGTKNHITAEIYYTVTHEQTLTLADLIKRRLDIGDHAPPSMATAIYCATIMQSILNWSDKTYISQIKDLFNSYSDFLI